MATVTFPTIGNNGITTLATGISNSITTVVVTSAAALGFTDSTTDGYITIVDASNYRKNPLTSPETLEICQVTAVSTNTLTVTRGVDGTSGTVFAAGAVIEVRINAAMIQRVYDALTDGTDDINVGGATFAGDVEVGGDLTLGLSGVNKTWSHYIDARGFGNVNANTLVEGEVFAGGDTYLNYYGFPEDNSHGIGGSFSLPSDYDGSPLSFTIYWTAATGASVGETVRWAINVGSFEDGDDLTVVNSGPNTPTPTLTGVDELQMTVMTSFTPTNAVEGKDFISIYVRRLGGTFDTLAVDAKLFGVRIEYA